MSFKEKIKSKGFWKAVILFSVIYLIVGELLTLWWDYGFDFEAFNKKHFFENNFFQFAVSQILVGFIVGFVVLLISYKANPSKTTNER
jgi:di/tricarboxylate transporter